MRSERGMPGGEKGGVHADITSARIKVSRRKANPMRIKLPITTELDEDGFIVVSCPTLPGCHSQGRDIDEALDNIKDAIEIYIGYTREIPNQPPISNSTQTLVKVNIPD